MRELTDTFEVRYPYIEEIIKLRHEYESMQNAVAHYKADQEVSREKIRILTDQNIQANLDIIRYVRIVEILGSKMKSVVDMDDFQ